MEDKRMYLQLFAGEGSGGQEGGAAQGGAQVTEGGDTRADAARAVEGEVSGEQFGMQKQKWQPADGEAPAQPETVLGAETEQALRALIDNRIRESEERRRVQMGETGVEKLRQEVGMYRQRAQERAAFAELARQAGEMRDRGFPQFDLAAQMQDPVFRRMVLPASMNGAGLTVEQAYAATHYRDMLAAGMQAAEQRARQSAANSIRSGTARPVENGAVTERAARMEADPSKFTRRDFEELSRRAALGEKIGF